VIRDPQHLFSNGSATVRAHLPLQQSGSSFTGALSSQHKERNNIVTSGNASYKMTTRSTTPVDPNKSGCRPKSGNWRQQNLKSTVMSSTRFLSTMKMFIPLLKSLNL
jgi:hypothetical protein